jgi:predicted SnoaL-like aldol condensation-catalyzing enzyme
MRSKLFLGVWIIFAIIFAMMAPAGASAANTPQEEANKKRVLEFYDRVLNRKEADAATEYIGKKYIQHNPLVPDGVEALQAFVRKNKAESPQSRSVVKRAFAEGDYVILHVHASPSPKDRGLAIVDIFRLEDGKIVEHWDVIQPVPEKAANPNGMF